MRHLLNKLMNERLINFIVMMAIVSIIAIVDKIFGFEITSLACAAVILNGLLGLHLNLENTPVIPIIKKGEE